ncbi:OmpA family protein [Caminibacter mediatlanticus]|uniref:OmpA domain protein n=1 Tax=Caminibacter mediatlanticus TB-2 TaxID=391592 RepID=A0AAI9AG90_9BACT|nr:OmpA family protein [Caminibacter mediatlanticus]EDM23108.1 OmpA domain protein [Caminibacter mediatlanticus TB-2]
MKKTIISLSLAAVSMFAATNYEFGASLGRNNVSNSPIADYNFLNLRIGKYLPKNHILRFELERSEKFGGNNALTNQHLTRALVNVEHYFTLENSAITPYAFIGAGYQWVSGDYDNNVVADLGIGAKYLISSKWDAFVELRGLRDFGNNDNHYGALIGFTYKCGTTQKAAPVPAPMPVEKPAPKDSDGDGVVDSMDSCPNTPAGVKVDANGCPIDSDGDGVADYLDKCPNTPAGVKVNANGCPVDSDGDGVADYLDKCPNTPKGFKVDQNGCAITYNFEINFDTNSAKIKPEYMPKIEKFAEFLKNHPDVKAEIQGYTDNRGSATYNMILSEKRAKAVYEALLKLGVNKDQITFVGYGEANPIASNDTPEGRAKNRRVVAKIYY